MAEANEEQSNVKKSKNKVKRIFGFGKKKKKSSGESAEDCPYCTQKNQNLNISPSTKGRNEEDNQKFADVSRKFPNSVEDKPEFKSDAYRETVNNCNCARCKRQRGEDPLTLELLPMDTQVTMQNSLLANSLQDAGFMCCIL